MHGGPKRFAVFFMDLTDELVAFAKKFYPAYEEMPGSILRTIFEKYKGTTIICRNDQGEIQGFAVYQEWPSILNFILICGRAGHVDANLRAMLLGRHHLPRKPIAYFDETKMKLRIFKIAPNEDL